eukprot:scaffold88269_cov63-Phaeocystis_antarctica.AAC.3
MSTSLDLPRRVLGSAVKLREKSTAGLALLVRVREKVRPAELEEGDAAIVGHAARRVVGAHAELARRGAAAAIGRRQLGGVELACEAGERAPRVVDERLVGRREAQVARHRRERLGEREPLREVAGGDCGDRVWEGPAAVEELVPDGRLARLLELARHVHAHQRVVAAQVERREQVVVVDEVESVAVHALPGRHRHGPRHGRLTAASDGSAGGAPPTATCTLDLGRVQGRRHPRRNTGSRLARPPGSWPGVARARRRLRRTSG